MQEKYSGIYKNKQSSFSLAGGGVLKSGMLTDWRASGNCCKHDGPSALASTILPLKKATGGFQRLLPVGDCA